MIKQEESQSFGKQIIGFKQNKKVSSRSRGKLEDKNYPIYINRAIIHDNVESLSRCQCLKCVNYMWNDNKWFFYLTIVLFLNKKKDKGQLQNIICSLVRQNKYVIVIVSQIIQDKYIKGFKQISEQLNKQVILRIEEALRNISDSDKIYVSLDIIQFKNRFFSSQSTLSQYGIKLHLRVDRGQKVPIYFSIAQSKKKSFSKLWKNQYCCGQRLMEGQDIYLSAISQLQIMRKINKASNIVEHWEVNKKIGLPSKQIQSKLKIITNYSKSLKYQFCQQPDGYFKKICIIFYQSKFEGFFMQNFYQSTIVVQIDESQQIEQVLRKFERLFDSNNIKCRLIIPFAEFQEQNIVFKKEHKINKSLSYIVAYTFCASYSKFRSAYNEKLGKQFNLVVKVDEIKNWVRTEQKMTFFQIQLFNRVIMDKYSESPIIERQDYTSNKKVKQWIIQISFKRQDISTFSFLLLYFGLKKPAFYDGMQSKLQGLDFIKSKFQL